jgi:hypothetical protein
VHDGGDGLDHRQPSGREQCRETGHDRRDNERGDEPSTQHGVTWTDLDVRGSAADVGVAIADAEDPPPSIAISGHARVAVDASTGVAAAVRDAANAAAAAAAPTASEDGPAGVWVPVGHDLFTHLAASLLPGPIDVPSVVHRIPMARVDRIPIAIDSRVW